MRRGPTRYTRTDTLFPDKTLFRSINGPSGILSALYGGERTGAGRHIDVSLMDGLMGMLGYIAQLAFFTGKDPQRVGSQHPNLVPYGIFPARDGSIVIACLTPGFWSRICRSIERPELVDDPDRKSTRLNSSH